MSKATDRMRRHLAELIREEVESFNGWSLNEESKDTVYSRVAEKVIEYLTPQIDVRQQKRRISGKTLVEAGSKASCRRQPK